MTFDATKASLSDYGHAGVAKGVHPPRDLLLQLTIFLLPFSYIPYEFGIRGVNITPFIAILVIIVSMKYGALSQRPSAFETTSLLFAALIAVRLLILGPLEGTVPNLQEVASSVGTPIAAVFLFRVARQARLRPVIRNALRRSLAFLVAMAVYQIVAGLPYLKGLGYDEGFYYFTFSGHFRPFGTFLSPTVFAAYLAIAGITVSFLHRGTAARLWFFVTVAGLLMTQTRAACIAAGVGCLVAFFYTPGRARSKVIMWLVPIALITTLIVTMVALLDSGAAHTLSSDRLLRIFDDADTSHTARRALWSGVLQVTLKSPLIGYGKRPFDEVLRPVIGDAAMYGHAHENFIQILYMYGFLGLLVFLLMIFFAYREIIATIKYDRKSNYAYAAIAGLVVFIVDSLFETTWTSLGVITMLYLVIGLGYSQKIGTQSVLRFGKRIQPPLVRRAAGRLSRQGNAILVAGVAQRAGASDAGRPLRTSQANGPVK